jgi:hypothetical protein
MSHLIARAVLGSMFAAGLWAADITGIWVGQQQGRRGEPEDVAFRFKLEGGSLTGKMFGDEFDIPIAEASISGDQIKFTITTANYYSGSKVKYIYTGAVNGAEIEIVRERVQTPQDTSTRRAPSKQTLKLKRLT